MGTWHASSSSSLSSHSALHALRPTHLSASLQLAAEHPAPPQHRFAAAPSLRRLPCAPSHTAPAAAQRRSPRRPSACQPARRRQRCWPTLAARRPSLPPLQVVSASTPMPADSILYSEKVGWLRARAPHCPALSPCAALSWGVLPLLRCRLWLLTAASLPCPAESSTWTMCTSTGGHQREAAPPCPAARPPAGAASPAALLVPPLIAPPPPAPRHVILPPDIAQLVPKGHMLSEVCVGAARCWSRQRQHPRGCCSPEHPPALRAVGS